MAGRETLEAQISSKTRRIAAQISGVYVAKAGNDKAAADVNHWVAGVDQARADAANAEQGVARMKAEWTYASNNLHRLEPLLEKQFITAGQVDRAPGNSREGQLRHIRPGMHADVRLISKPNERFRGIVDSIGFGVTAHPDMVGRLGPGLPDVQRTLNWVHPAARYPVRVRVENPPADVLRVGQTAVATIGEH